jgi:chromosome segregation ATPase
VTAALIAVSALALAAITVAALAVRRSWKLGDAASALESAAAEALRQRQNAEAELQSLSREHARLRAGQRQQLDVIRGGLSQCIEALPADPEAVVPRLVDLLSAAAERKDPR